MWKLPLLEARTSITGNVDAEIVAVFQDSGKKAIPPKGPTAVLVEKLRKADAFKAKQGSIQFIRFAEKGSSENTLLLGLGMVTDLTDEKLRLSGAATWSKLVAERCDTALVQVDGFFEAKGSKSNSTHSQSIRAFAEGLILSAYQYVTHKSKRDSEDYFGPAKIIFLTREKSLKTQLDTELVKVTSIGECVRVTRDWSNEPSNYGTPVYYANEAKKLALEYGLKCTILNEKDAAREKMGLFLGVGQGAEREGRIVVLEYNPKHAKGAKTVAFVGKGVTFDSGGISIKPSSRMEDMKHDMTGAATLMGATLLASEWQVPNRVITILGFTENMPDGDAIQPGNVLTSRNGKTVEIINTDAEGRLVLADILDYAQDFKPDAIVDAATLTGAVTIALGKHCCAILGNDDTLIEALKKAGDSSHERMWQLPLYDEYFEDLKSDYADMKNSANDSYGGTIRGAIFLKQFIKKNTPWAHLDIAATANGMGHLPYFPKRGASGSHVRALAQFLLDF